jgi:hypothetical protein
MAQHLCLILPAFGDTAFSYQLTNAERATCETRATQTGSFPPLTQRSPTRAEFSAASLPLSWPPLAGLEFQSALRLRQTA